MMTIIQKLWYCKSVIIGKFGTILFFDNGPYICLVIKDVTGVLVLDSSKKYGPVIKDTINPHHTITFGDCSETCLEHIPKTFSINL